MDLRSRIAEALVEAQMCADTTQPLSAARYADAVMGVVEGHWTPDAARVLDLTEQADELKEEVRHWRTEAMDAMRVMERRGEYVKELKARVRALEDENQRMRDELASRIVEEERAVQEQITKEPLNSWLAGVLFGLQRGRDIVTSPAREIAEEEA